MRPSARRANQLREVTVKRNINKYAEGSVLINYGNTQVMCVASFLKGQVPKFRKNSGSGWLKAEYSMLPRSTHDRIERDVNRGKVNGRVQEIQRLIGRSLRNCIDLEKLGEHTIAIDCDVIQADGGTRTASITGGCIALFLALKNLYNSGVLKKNPWKEFVAAISVGVFNNMPVLDLDYAEDSNAYSDMNIVMNESQQFIEIQGSAEAQAFSENELTRMLGLAKQGINELLEIQQECCQDN